MATAKAVDKLPIQKADRKDLYYVIAHSPMMAAAVAGVKTGTLASPSVAAAYLFAEIIDTSSRTKDSGHIYQGIMAGQAAHFALQAAGATVEDAQEAIDELVAMHERSADNLAH